MNERNFPFLPLNLLCVYIYIYISDGLYILEQGKNNTTNMMDEKEKKGKYKP